MKQKSLLEHHETIWEEILCHFPYAIFSVALSLIFLSLLTYSDVTVGHVKRLFHSFHYLHLLFAGTGVVLSFSKYSKSLLGMLCMGFIVPTIFCTVSDSVMPYLGGMYLGIPMHFHWCFISHLSVVLPILSVGVLNGLVMGSHESRRKIYYSTTFHFLHILVSALASILYLVGYGFSRWDEHFGFVFLFLIGAVLIPCTLSDIVVPMLFARRNKNNTCNTQTHSGLENESPNCH
jgi:hypothetical protein